jgi:Tol biopolymer transport system component/DNA-binding winged helix-turn-helix (wHTH) protein
MSGVENRWAVCRFGAYELETRSGELRKHGVRIKLQEQPRQILMLLLERPGEIVTREEIQKRLWPDGTFVDFDNAINSAVRKLRDALNDSADNPRFVETVARRGYRFAAPASLMPKEASDPQPAPAVLASNSPVLAPRHKWEWAGAVALVVIAAILVLIQRHTTSATGVLNIRVQPLTSNLGLELQPSFSPDGTRVAYSWDGRNGGTFAIYTKLVGAGDPVRMARDEGRDFSPAWSPDGFRVAALRDLGTESAIILMPASGGQHQELTRVKKAAAGAEVCVRMGGPHICGLNYWGSVLSWSPDGKYLFTSGHAGPGSALAILRVSADTGALSTITSPPPEIEGDYGAVPSPDGRNLAFVRMAGAKVGDIYVAPLTGGKPDGRPPRKITSDNADVESIAWTPDGRDLLFSSDRRGRRELWRIGISDAGEPQRVNAIGENATDLAISPDGKRLVYGRGGYIGSLWKTPIAGSRAGKPVRVTASTARDKFSHISPDGKRIVFQSARSGVDEIWWSDMDGGNATQLTNFGKGMSGSPRWSPDGRTVAFDSNHEGGWEIYVIRASGGTARRLTNGNRNNFIPSWSRDGRWVYFSSSRTGRLEIWKIREDGTSEMQVTRNGGFASAESVDGTYLYYKSGPEAGELWKMPVAGGPAAKVLDSVSGRIFTVEPNGIFYAAADRGMQLHFLDFETGAIRGIAPLSLFAHADVSPDQRWVVYPDPGKPETNLLVVENFR